MGLWCLKILFFLFVGFSLVSLSFGIYLFDLLIIAIGFLLILAAILVVLELRQLHSGPFQRD